MKKDLQKLKTMMVAGVLGMAALASGNSHAEETAKLATTSSSELKVELPTQGRALLTAEDLQTLLGIRSRDPSSRGAEQLQDVADSAASFESSLSQKEKKQVAYALNLVRMKRADLEEELRSSSLKKKAQLREKRRNIQLSRVKTGEEGHQRLGRQLFSSLLAEANAEARVDAALKAFDQEHSVEIQFVVSPAGQKEISAIKIGSDTVWTSDFVTAGI